MSLAVAKRIVRKVRGAPTAAERRFATDWKRAVDRLGASASEGDLLAGIAAGDAGAVTAAFNWRRYERDLNALDPHLREAFGVGGKQGASEVGLAKALATMVARLDLNNPRAIAWNDQNGARLVVETSAAQQQAIRDIAGRSLAGEFDVRAAARTIRGVVGLHSRYSNAVWNYVRGLSEAGMAPDQIASLADRYSTKLLNTRANTIARTEIMKAQNAGRVEGWNQAFDAGLVSRTESRKQFLVTGDDRTCEQCLAIEGEIVGIDQTFSDGSMEPPIHPDCRCVISLLAAPGTGTPAAAPVPEPTAPAAAAAAVMPSAFTSTQEIENWMNQAYPDISFDLGEGTLGSMEPSMREMHRLLQEYPQAQEELRAVTLPLRFVGGEDPTEVYALVYQRAGEAGSKMELSPYWYQQDAETLQHRLYIDELSKFHTKNATGIESVIQHEFGHVVHNELLSASGQAFSEYVRSSGFGLVQDTAKAFLKTRATGALSEYALKNEYESFAEGFAYLQNNAITTRTTEYVKRLDELLKATKNRIEGWRWQDDIASPEERQAVGEELRALAERILGPRGRTY